MNVLIGTALGFGTGGVKSHISALREAIRSNGIESEVIVPDNQTVWWKLFAALKAAGDIDRGRTYLTEIRVDNVWRKVQSRLQVGDISLVHAHDVLLASRFQNSNLSVALTVHGPLSREAVMLGKGSKYFLSYLKRCEKVAYERATAIIAVDSGQRDIIIEDYRISPQKVHVILNAVDTDRFSPSPSCKTTKGPYYLVPRRLVPKNGVHIAIEAMRLLWDVDAELWIAGDGPERMRLEEMVKTARLKRVRFLGSVDQNKMIALMDQALGIIVPSVPINGVVEASSIAALEGMSMAKPVVASNIGGLAEIITDGKTGVLFDAGNAEDLATQLRKLLEDEHYRLEIGRRARAYVIENHSLEIWARNIIEVYKSVL